MEKVERSGQGVDKIFRQTIREGKGIPDYSRSSDYNVMLIIDAVVNESMLQVLDFLLKVVLMIKESIGNNELLKLPKTAFLCSRQVPAGAVLKCYDWAIAQREGQGRMIDVADEIILDLLIKVVCWKARLMM